MIDRVLKSVWVMVLLAAVCGGAGAANLAFESGTFGGWTVEGEETWSIGINPELFTNPGDPRRWVVNSLEKGESKMGVLRSRPFVIRTALQRFSVAGWDGTETTNNGGDRNHVLLRSHPDGAILRRTRTPGGDRLTPMHWSTNDLIGREVYLEVVDGNPVIRQGGFAWIAFADYRQDWPKWSRPITTSDLFGVRIDSAAETATCRSVPFLAAHPDDRGATTRTPAPGGEVIPIGASAEVVYLLGMMNWGWDYGLAHWGGHPELRARRDDQVHVGSRIGDVEIRYDDGSSDRIPIVIGATAWFVAQWAHGPTHMYVPPVREPFASRPEYACVLAKSLRVREDEAPVFPGTEHRRYYLAVKPRPKKIESIAVYDNPDLLGWPLVAAVTLAGADPAAGLHPFGNWQADRPDLEPAFSTDAVPKWSADLAALSAVLYTRESDLPKQVEPVEFPEGLDAARIRFIGEAEADMLTSIWTANLTQIHEKFESDTGYFRETGKTCPWYGGYSGIGTWAPAGIYADGAYSRTSDHYVTLALRCIKDPRRATSYVDFCDKWLYFYRADNDPANGPDNSGLDISRYPKDAPPHWAFVMTGPLGMPGPINEIPGDEETDGHGATIVGRWVAWRSLGAPRGEWLTAPRKDVYGKSRWDATRDAAEFICWLVDYTGMDVMWCEGETTGWAAGGALIPPGMADETDPVKVRRNYANSDMYEPYPTYVCLTALRCSAQMAEAIGNAELAARWRAYADRMQAGMVRLLRTGEHGNFMWRTSPYSVYPSLQDSLVQAWFSIYYDGLDPQRLDPTMTATSRNTLKRQTNQLCGLAPVLAMGYGQGWLTKAALILDDMDSAGPLLANLAKYSYDKNMDYADPSRGIDWRRWLWLIPEGTNILPDGSWHRIGDLTNGANQGPAMHALELCAGIDDTDPRSLRIIPRAPGSLRGIEVSNFFTLVPDGYGFTRARIRYQFKRPGLFYLKSDRPLPSLAVRLGPLDEQSARQSAQNCRRPAGSTVRAERSGTWNGANAWWVWIEGLANVSTLELDLGTRRGHVGFVGSNRAYRQTDPLVGSEDHRRSSER